MLFYSTGIIWGYIGTWENKMESASWGVGTRLQKPVVWPNPTHHLQNKVSGLTVTHAQMRYPRQPSCKQLRITLKETHDDSDLKERIRMPRNNRSHGNARP